MANSASDQPNGTSAAPKSNGAAAGPQSSSSQSSPAAPSGKGELSNAEKKKMQKQEKAARRAKEKGSNETHVPEQKPSASSEPAKGKQPQKPSKTEGSKSQDEPLHRRRRASTVTAPPNVTKLPVRPAVLEKKTAPMKQISFVAHLQGQARKRTLDGTPKEVHPAISQLALQLSSYIICGSHARAVAMLLAFKAVVQSYSTPHGTSLTRHFVSHYLPPQIDHLKAARPLSTTQANAIRWLKNFIAKIDPSAAEDTAKNDICLAIDVFIGERFTVADQVIADTAADRIDDGDIVATFGKSAVVQSTLLKAVAKGKRFEVVVLDSRPLFEGKNLAHTLSHAGIPVRYALLSGVSGALKGTSKCLLGAHTVLANGKIQSRAGAALVAMMAKKSRSKVIICAETVKFTERTALDSIVTNEVAPEEELLNEQEAIPEAAAETSLARTEQDNKKDSKGKDAKGKPDYPSTAQPPDSSNKSDEQDPLATWRSKDNLRLLNLLYDVMPAQYIDEIITELGSLPAGSAAAVQRISGDIE